MKANPAHLLDPVERREIVNTIIATRPQFTQTWREFDELRQDFRENAPATCMIVVGETGVGKTTLIQEYERLNLPIRTSCGSGIATRRPVSVVSLKGQSSSGAAAQTILKKLLGITTVTGRLASLTDRIESQLKLQGVELLILDEFQHLAEAGAEKTRSQTADWIKGLAKETRVPIVLVGMPSLAEVILANAQLASITPLRRELGNFSYDSKNGRATFHAFLDEIDSKFPFHSKAGFAEPWFAEKLFAASGGNPRFLCRLLQWSAKSAIREDAKAISLAHLEVVFDRIGGLGSIGDGNPFSMANTLRAAS